MKIRSKCRRLSITMLIAAIGSAATITGQVQSEVKITSTHQGSCMGLNAWDFSADGLERLPDLDGDGTDELVIGASSHDDGGSETGAIWIMFMRSDGTVKSCQEISDSQGGMVGQLSPGGQFGFSIASIGDLNLDGTEDLAVGAFQDGGTGALWILFLHPDGTVKAHQKIGPSSGGFLGTLHNDGYFGVSVAAIGDLNRDGIVDLAVGASHGNDGGHQRGECWILFLNRDGTVQSNAMKISSTSGGFNASIDNGDHFGHAIEGINDFNCDGNVDIAVGAYEDDDGGSDKGAIYLLFLDSNATVLSYTKISQTMGGFGGALSVFDQFGSDIALMGDLNSDGAEDLAVSAKRDDDGGFDFGAVWILFLNSDGTVRSEEKISATAGGFSGSLSATDHFGYSLACLGDLNGDQRVDLAVGAPGDDTGGPNHGATWILFLDYRPNISLSAQNLIGGSRATFKVKNGSPFEQTWLIYSLSGGSCSQYFAPLNVVFNVCSPLTQPGNPLRTGMADLNGEITWGLPMPGVSTVTPIWFQAVQSGRITPVVATAIQP